MNQEWQGEGGDFDTAVPPPLSPFYDTPMPDDAEVGELFAAEPVADAPPEVRMYRILYVSTDLQGNRLPVSGVYAAPAAQGPNRGYPLVSFAHGTTGVGRMCGISHTPFQPSTPGYTAWVPHLKPLLDAGLAVVGSDYSGMGAPGPSSYLVWSARGARSPGRDAGGPRSVAHDRRRRREQEQTPPNNCANQLLGTVGTVTGVN
ncbi:hypothetical protein C6V83_02385 [Gordonia iterans]|uniref:Lipase n=1 Tax=Gordonia iterans TaxID=1004901 RepID=A0A2S0KCA0_9ACTN|nr:hypothetical protein [Gordonia iterans]AVL99314.1 hypothetical protein C6V83_02385 [Gordonia iterans]